jgi:hypothetical protein
MLYIYNIYLEKDISIDRLDNYPALPERYKRTPFGMPPWDPSGTHIGHFPLDSPMGYYLD